MPKKSKKDLEVEVSEKNFDDKVINQSKKTPVVADFFAEWCMPCLMLGPTLEKIAKDYKGKFILAKINVEDNQKLAQKFNVMSIPAVKLFRDGKVVSEFVGALPESKIKEWLDSNL